MNTHGGALRAYCDGGVGMSGPWSGRRLHFVGVGGAGMSAYARAAHALGAEVSGSDAADGPYLERLAADGVLRGPRGPSRGERSGGGGRGAVLLLGGRGGERRAPRGARAGHPRAPARGAAGAS